MFMNNVGAYLCESPFQVIPSWVGSCTYLAKQEISAGTNAPAYFDYLKKVL
jgi:hypothetical protein